MRVHIVHNEHTVLVPVPASKLAEYTVANLTEEASRRLSALAKTDVVLTKLTASGSILFDTDLVQDVLVDNEKLFAFTASDESNKKEAEAEEENKGKEKESEVPKRKKVGVPLLTTSGDDTPKTFTVSAKEVKNEYGDVESHVMVTIEDQNLKNVVNTFINDEVFYEERPQVEAETLFCHLSQFKANPNAHYRSALQPLIEWLDRQFEVPSPLPN
jgi:hypothetical protein